MQAFWAWFLKGGPIMWPLLACSILSATVILERVWFWWRERRRTDESLVQRILALVEAGACDEAVRLGGPRADMCVQVIQGGLMHRDHGLTEAMQVEAARQAARMRQGLGILDTIITLAPLLGILGTVTGIIKSFDLLGQGGIDDPRAVSSGIAEALITTAAGLGVAILTLLPYNYFVARMQTAVALLEKVATQMEVAYRRGRERPVPSTNSER